jgi:hypothetical protein
MKEVAYDRAKAVEYARKWALGRNSRYINFSGIGGDCTNFASQCLLAGGAVPNYKLLYGWYYNTANDRAPAWSSVEYFHRFLTNTKAEGPYAVETGIENMQIGDIIQLKTNLPVYHHTLLICDIGEVPAPDNILICAHTYDSLDRPLSTYDLTATRYLHIEGIRAKD